MLTIQDPEIPQWLLTAIPAFLVFIPNLILAIIQIAKSKHDAVTSESSSAKVIAEAVDILIQPLKDRIIELSAEKKALAEENDRLKLENVNYKERISVLEKENAELKLTVCRLTQKPCDDADAKPRPNKRGTNKKE